ncbi:alpha/beta hydrolase [Paludisphaera sp.]|uniref:alpha/beta hydrolase n=1 Tax=Paludisphaera sp. TaxID=2017432 RepID=UPI00301CF7DC
MTMRRAAFAIALSALALPLARGEEPNYERIRDVVYGRKYGAALTMDVIKPKADANGAGILFMASGGFVSSPDMIQPPIFQPLVDRGYTVFAVVHACQPRFQVNEIVSDVNRAVRFIRAHAKEYGVDPDRMGVYGGSAGGHLSLMLGTAGTDGDPTAADPVEHQSSRVRAVACFFPPTDLLNWGEPGAERIHATDHLPPFRAAFDYRELDTEEMLWIPIIDEDRLRERARAVSPITHVTADDAPTLIIHGDADELVPLQQSESFKAKLDEAGVPNKLIVRPGMTHSLPTLEDDLKLFADWFDEHLKPSK